MFFRCLAIISSIVFCLMTDTVDANVDPSFSIELAKESYGAHIRESLLKSKAPYSKAMMSFRTMYCTNWQEMKKLIAIESKGRDSVDVYHEQDSCDVSCLTFWPEKILEKFTFHTGQKLLAVQALQSDLMSTVFVFLRPSANLHKHRRVGSATSIIPVDPSLVCR
jgi:hypothetical protein